MLIPGKPFQSSISMADRFRDHLTVPIFVDMFLALLALVVVPGKPSHASIIIAGKSNSLIVELGTVGYSTWIISALFSKRVS